MQIKNIIVYKDVSRYRVVDFDLGKVNIITGESQSGKTLLISIIEYCLGSKECNIAYGVVRETVKWFSITVVFPDGEHLFVARQNPHFLETENTERVYMERVAEGTIPLMDSFEENSTTTVLRDYLTSKLGIKENLQSPIGYQEPLEVKFQHMLFPCFQPQTLIAQNKMLFYHQEEPFVSMMIKQVFPYVIGAIKDDAYAIELQIKEKQANLNSKKRKQSEIERIAGNGYCKALSLIDEAKQFEILDGDVNPETFEDAMKVLNSTKEWAPSMDAAQVNGSNHILRELIEQRMVLKNQLGELEDTISVAKAFIRQNSGFSDEVIKQVSRLSSIKLFKRDEELATCPFCHSTLEHSIPSISAIRSSLESMNRMLDCVNKEEPRLTQYLSTLCKKKSEIRAQISGIEQSITNIYAQEDAAKSLRDLNIQRGKILGRISLFLDSVSFVKDNTLTYEISALENEIAELKAKVDADARQQALDSILATVNSWMTGWIKELDVEHESASVIFNISRLSLLSLIGDDYVPLSQLGSGANWVSYHLLIMHALHKLFIQRKRPTPHFLILDQPSQVYFPSSVAELSDNGGKAEDHDIAMVKKMYDFIFNRTEELNGELQVIITDHAMLDDDRFRNSVKEVWRGGMRLIPEEWYNNESCAE